MASSGFIYVVASVAMSQDSVDSLCTGGTAYPLIYLWLLGLFPPLATVDRVIMNTNGESLFAPLFLVLLVVYLEAGLLVHIRILFLITQGTQLVTLKKNHI